MLLLGRLAWQRRQGDRTGNRTKRTTSYMGVKTSYLHRLACASPAGELGLLSDVFMLAVDTANLLARVATQRYTLIKTPLVERRCVSAHDCLNPIQIDCLHADHEVVNFWPHVGCSLAGEAGTGWPQHVSVRSDCACKNSQLDLFGANTHMHLAPCPLPPSSPPPPADTSAGTPVAGPTPAGLSPPQALGGMRAFRG